VRELTLRLEDENNKSFRTERDYQEIINQLKKEKETAINVKRFNLLISLEYCG
jgi:hypothetical protein